MAEKPEVLDIEAWLAGAELPEATVRVSSKGKAVVERAKLLKEQRTNATGRMANPVDPATTKRINELTKLIEQNERDFTLRGLDGDTAVALQQEHSGSGSEFDEHLVAASLIEPKMTQAQVHSVRMAVGEGQFRRLAKAAASLTFDSEPTVDF